MSTQPRKLLTLWRIIILLADYLIRQKCRNPPFPLLSILTHWIRDEKAIKCYLRAIKPTDPVEVVDSKQLPMSDLELKKLERMGKVQKARYLKAREEKRAQLIEEEKAKQERRIQDSHSRLFRLYLYQVRDTQPNPLPFTTFIL